MVQHTSSTVKLTILAVFYVNVFEIFLEGLPRCVQDRGLARPVVISLSNDVESYREQKPGIRSCCVV